MDDHRGDPRLLPPRLAGLQGGARCGVRGRLEDHPWLGRGPCTARARAKGSDAGIPTMVDAPGALRRYPESTGTVGDRSVRRAGTAKRRADGRGGDQGTQTTQVAVDPGGKEGVDGGLRLLHLPTDHRYQHPVLLWPAAAYRTVPGHDTW